MDVHKIPGYAASYQPGKSEIFPIPLVELNANASLQQNPIWE